MLRIPHLLFGWRRVRCRWHVKGRR